MDQISPLALLGSENTRVDIPKRMPRAARHRVNQKAPSVAILALFIRREVVAENHGQRVTALL